MVGLVLPSTVLLGQQGSRLRLFTVWQPTTGSLGSERARTFCAPCKCRYSNGRHSLDSPFNISTPTLSVTVGITTDLVSTPIPGAHNQHTERHPRPGKVRLSGPGRAVETRR